jgi:hypothetical protein
LCVILSSIFGFSCQVTHPLLIVIHGFTPKTSSINLYV